MNAIRVMIADDHELVRMALRTLLDGEDDLEVVAEAGDTDGAVEGALKHRPDVLLLDLRMPGGGGVEVCRRVKEQAPETAVLVITSFDGDDELFGVLDAGANGYLMKDTRPDRVAQAIRSVFNGQAVFDAAIASRVISGRTNGVDANAMLADPLSEREREVLGLMSRGLGNKDIGKELWISETTVKTHVSHILRKLGQSDRTQAVLTALRMGIVALEDAV
ncbi:MAG TPA: response regulator transcription factor [Coriobacteriia bacterium]|nr:response regulator transcription factor [Coriobacteriia bacterium]